MAKSQNLPIINKSYAFYKHVYGLRNTLPKQDRYVIWQRIENIILDIIENIFFATASKKKQKIKLLEEISVKLNVLRILVRLSKDVKAINNKKYISLQENLNEIGRMLGGWIKFTKNPQKR